MKYGRVEGIDKPVPRLVQGTLMLSTDNLEGGIAFLDSVRAQGCNGFDTAPVYGNGQAERALGAWMDRRGNRSDVFILSKGCHPNADRGRRVTVFDLASDLFDSLARLKTDYIDLYLLHRDDPGVPVGPLVEALNEHVSEGRIRAFGGSNWSANRIREANCYARNHGLRPFVASSPNFSLAVRVKEVWEGCLSISGPQGAEERAWYRESQMPVFSWSSLAQGFFSGLLTRENITGMASEITEGCAQVYGYEENFVRLERAIELAGERGKTVAQIALAFLYNQPLNVFTVSGCRSAEESRLNREAMEVRLTPEELDWLDLRREKR
ncbi:MAG: aldo/keto reductase [Candidatus Latescibacteria bacterium]|nr:aldo/keto reductase [Candidatus Latescibacterota bacterium]